MSCRKPGLYQLAVRSSVNVSSGAPFDIGRLASDETYRREVPITPDAGRMLAALLSGVVATQQQVVAAAASGVTWPQLGLTINEHANESWSSMIGARPQGHGPNGGSGLAFNSLQVFDGGTTGLSAVNVVGILSPTVVAAVNRNPRSPFFIR